MMDTVKAAAPSNTHWFYEFKGERKGAVTEAEIVALIRNGTLGYGSTVWADGFEQWQKLENTSLKQYIADMPPPLEGSRVNNSMVWLLAFAPLLGYMLEWFVAGFVHGTEYRIERAMAESDFWYITVLLNVLLSVLDERKLKKAGHNTRRFSHWVFLVPVYLYQRAKSLNQGLGYFITWIVCFVMVVLTAVGGDI